MNYRKKSPKLLFIATALTIIALLSVLVTAAVLLGTFQGGNVTVGGVTGTITYSSDNAHGPWTSTLQSGVAANPWFACFNITSSSYVGSAKITWTLQSYDGSTWSNVTSATVITTVTLTGSAQDVFASADGTLASNQDWHTYSATPGTYHLIIGVASA
jgi:hypothetical protein